MSNQAKNLLKVYGFIGKTLCGIAGGIVAFVLAGPVLAILGAVLGILSGHLFEKAVIKVA